MKTQHTEGKWQQSHRVTEDDGGYNTQVYTEDTVICTLDWAGHKEDDGKTTTSMREANAKLIAAAPELLEALQSALSKLNQARCIQNCSQGTTPHGDQYQWCDEISKHEDVIKKATE